MENELLVEYIIDSVQAVSVDYQIFKTAIKEKGRFKFKNLERIWCYELYFIMRKWTKRVFAEVDKRGHEAIESDFIPDFVLHVPGVMDKNEAVIEVKISKNYAKGILKDFNTINKMLKNYGYKIGFWILVNYNMEDAKKLLTRLLKTNKDKNELKYDVDLNFEQTSKNIYVITKDLQQKVECKCLSEILGK